MGLFSKKPKELEIIAPVDGEVIALDKVEDEVFSQKMLGEGLAIKPSAGNFIAPIAGKLITVFPTGHAYGIKSNNGVEMLLHIGMDTVSLNGKGFDIQVKQDDNVKQGDLLCNVDLAVLKAENVPSLDTPIVFTPETMSGNTINIVKTGNVKQGEIIAVIK
ncbi:PTS sugar transporter subunit IIA [Spiroplasma endosymbiont of Megaselia nigra]|uniref:PTS sugar transporter subunit IIA n=1 Tax=Spiroplasma endosymbiont of Megaselia nigra TaxID=2478537 RepID=UPI000F878487|nr:PTS glucose transporter subunit IIA [Spiroplasma endosymbiont of Megaselia nigra]RUO86585.1 PTS glucose transporter subunit IIA [Spiroplasma endosymbiont of Megaselia nigra]